MQVIDIPHQSVVDPDTFEDYKLLSTTLEEHGADGMKGRFDALPIHQSCYKLNDTTNQADNDIIVNYFHSLQHNDPATITKTASPWIHPINANAVHGWTGYTGR